MVMPENEFKKIWIYDRMDEVESTLLEHMQKLEDMEPSLENIKEIAADAYMLGIASIIDTFVRDCFRYSGVAGKELLDDTLANLKTLALKESTLNVIESNLKTIADLREQKKS